MDGVYRRIADLNPRRTSSRVLLTTIDQLTLTAVPQTIFIPAAISVAVSVRSHAPQPFGRT